MKETQFTPASREERERYIIDPLSDVPLTGLVEGSFSRLVATEQMTLSFITMKAHSVFELHTHPHAQCMIVLDGYCDEVIGDKLYRVQKGDVLYLPPYTPHGAFLRSADCKALDIFCPSRDDYVAKYQEQNGGAPRFIKLD